MQEFNVDFRDLQLPVRDVYEVMGYHNQLPEDEIQKQTNHLIKYAGTLTRPRFAYLFADGILREDLLQTETETFHLGKIISRQLRKSECFVFFVATCGKEFEAWTNSLKVKDDILSTYIADSLGSCIVESTADYMEFVLRKHIGNYGWLHSNRYSPGYCEWSIDEQQKLFSLFPEFPCGIELTEHSLMMPIKSVSGIMGVGSKIRKMDYGCRICSLENCINRKRT